MSRKYRKGDVLKVGTVYGYGQSDNQFKLLCKHEDYLWVEWQGEESEIDTLYLDPATRKQIILFK